MTPDASILHLASHAAWLAAMEQGVYRADSLTTDGFIHCSKPSQIMNVANTFYRGQRGSVLLIIDPARLTSELRWESPVHPHPGQAPAINDDLFPHIYGPLNLDAVTKVLHFESAEDGTFSLPPGLEL